MKINIWIPKMRFHIICRKVRNKFRMIYRRLFNEIVVYDLSVSGVGKKVIKPKLFKLYQFKYKFFEDIPSDMEIFFAPGTSRYMMKKCIKNLKNEN